MTSDTASPALPDDELRETLDLLSTVIASVSDRVDSQDDCLDRLTKTARVREEKADRLKHLLPWFGLGAVVLALGLTVLLPRFLASSPATCAALGAEWTRTTSGVDACVFYDRR